MKISDIESRAHLQEAGFLNAIKTAVTGPAAKSFARGVGNELMSRWTGVDKPGGKDWFSATEPAPQTKIARQRIADEIIKHWSGTVSQVMAATKDPASGVTGVTDFTKIDKRQLSMSANLLISQLLAKLTNNTVKNIGDVDNLKSSDAVTKSLDPAKAATYVDRINDKLRNALNALMIADPTNDVGRTEALKQWQQVVNAAFLIKQLEAAKPADMYGLAGKKIARDASGNITVDGRVLDRTNPTDAATLNDLASQGLLPP